ncbi:class I adenylate-forming enzyme family protein [Nonomuraea dietziae]|uniref:class I adenylate-forming enzyme family protein n=1 Tax=Nonomuraea dietziae TaxID=65515 RepID=UPI0033D5FEFC
MIDIVSGVLDVASATPSRTALIAPGGEPVSYGALRERVLAIAHALASGTQGDEGFGALFAVRPGPDAVAMALGAVAAGGTLVLADPGLAPEVFAGRMALTRPRWVLSESLLYLLSGPLKGLARRRGLLLPNLRDPFPQARHLYTGRWLPGVPAGALRLDGLPAVQAVPRVHDHPAVVAFTSGTTEQPKGVVHTRRSLSEGLRLFTEAVSLGPEDIVHTDQFILGLPALIAGATWSMRGRGDFAQELAARGATHAFSVPVKLHELLSRTPSLPDTLRCLLLGAAPAPPAVLRKAMAAAPAARVLSVYAMTEALPIAIATAEDKLATTEGDLLGAPLPGVGARVAGDGELFVSGPHLAQGYLGHAPLTELPTGDLVRLDDHGRLVLLGRKKDMILRDGVNIYPGLYEPAIAALPGVSEAAIVGLADQDTGDEEVVLALTTTAGYDERALRGALPDLVDAAALPDRIVTLSELPRKGRSDKLDRAAIRTRVAR